MAQLTFSATQAGLLVPVWIGLDGLTTKALHTAGRPIPPPVQARGLLDTGSNVTAVGSWVLQQLALPVASTTATQTVAGPVIVRLFTVSLSITDPTQQGSPMLTHPSLLVMELATPLPDADVLIGLDILLNCQLLLDGPNRRFTLDF